MLKLEDCTKSELIKIITKELYVDDFEIKKALRKIQSDRDMKHYNKATEYGEKAIEHLNKYGELTRKYVGVKIIDIPLDDVKKMKYHLDKFNKYSDLEKKEEEKARKELANNG